MKILITGCYRSGTEYVTQLLNNHPNLAAKMYTTNFMRYYFKKYDPIAENYLKLINNAYDTIKSRHKIKFNLKNVINNIDKPSYGSIYDAIMSDLYINDEVKHWGEKTQLVWREIPQFLNMFPDGKCINIIRDPRSVLASFKKHTYAKKPLYLGAIFNCFDSMKHSVTYTNYYPNKFLNVKYEDVLMNEEDELKKIFDFLGLSSDHDLTSRVGWVDTSGNPWKDNTEFGKFSKTSSVNRWKKNLLTWEVDMCETINDKYMKKFGYERDIKPNITITWKYNKHPKVIEYLDLWRMNKGIQEFPTDPNDPSNWSENQ